MSARKAATKVLVGLMTIIFCTAVRAGPVTSPVARRDGVRVVSQGDDGATIEISVPRPRLVPFRKAGRVYHRLVIPEYPQWPRPGLPDFPALVIQVPLPGVESVSASVVSTEKKQSRLLNLYVPPEQKWTPEEVEAWLEDAVLNDPEASGALPDPQRELMKLKRKARASRPEGSPRAGVDEYEPAFLETLTPGEIVETGAPYWKGKQQFVNLLVNPLHYSSSRREVVFYPQIQVELEFEGQASPEAQDNDDPFPRYRQQFQLARAGCFRALVKNAGIHEIDYQDLLDAGFPLAGDPRDLKLFFRGIEVPIYFDGEEDGAYDPGDYLHFQGIANSGFFSQTSVYWLYQDTVPGLRMAEKDFSPLGRPAEQTEYLYPLHLEENHLYWVDMPSGEGQDHWFWYFAGFASGSVWNWQTNFQLQGVSAAGGTVPFTGVFYGITDIEGLDLDHHTRVSLNGNPVGDFYWGGKVEYVLQTDIPQSFFVEGTNTIFVEEIADTGAAYDYIYINDFDLSFYHDFEAGGGRLDFSAAEKRDYEIPGFTGGDLAMYDVTNPLVPRRIFGMEETGGPEYTLRFGRQDMHERKYTVQAAASLVHPPLAQDQPSDLDDRSRQVDYIVITHPNFSAAIQPLVAFRQGQGLTVEVFDIQDVYDTFGFGNFDPRAIKRFLKYAFFLWSQPSPEYALLVGDGNYDYCNYGGTGATNYLPPHLFSSSYSETAADNWFACVAGNDRVPDLSLGRFCVRTSAEASAMVQKVLNYENQSSGVPWQQQVMMVADKPDAGGDFPTDSDNLIASYIFPPYVAEKAYHSVLGTAATKTAIINGINSGRLIVNYLGHGSTTSWGKTATIFSNGTLASLTNATKLPFMTTMTCMNGYWSDVAGDCLAEAMTKTANKGTAANFSPSGFCLNNVSRRLAAFLFQDLLVNGNKTIGPAITQAKALLGGIAPYEELDMYTLFGDPALTLK